MARQSIAKTEEHRADIAARIAKITNIIKRDHNMSGKDISIALGGSATVLSGWSKYGNMTQKWLEMYCAYTGVRYQWVVDGKGRHFNKTNKMPTPDTEVTVVHNPVAAFPLKERRHAVLKQSTDAKRLALIALIPTMSDEQVELLTKFSTASKKQCNIFAQISDTMSA